MTSLLEQINGYLLGGQPIKRQDRKAGETVLLYQSGARICYGRKPKNNRYT